MSRRKKILTILHLGFAFTFLCWLLIQPYVKEVVTQKSAKALFAQVMEKEALFRGLSSEKQKAIVEGFEQAKKKSKPSFLHEIGHLFFVSTPPFALAWLFFSLAIPLLLLFRIEGAALATWLLPLIVLGYAYFLYSEPVLSNESLFPTEEYVRSHYIEKSEFASLNQRESLLLGWHRYLILEWAHEAPSEEKKKFSLQLEKGLFAFNVARLEWLLADKGDEIVTKGFMAHPSILRIICYFIWNLSFAWFMNRKEKHSPSEVVSNPV